MRKKEKFNNNNQPEAKIPERESLEELLSSIDNLLNNWEINNYTNFT